MIIEIKIRKNSKNDENVKKWKKWLRGDKKEANSKAQMWAG